MLEHLPALQVILPLLGAPLCALLPNYRLAWFCSSAITWSTCVIAILLFQTVSDTGIISYAMGGWSAPVGITYKIDMLNASILVLVTFIASLMMPYASKSIMIEVQPEKQPTFYAVYLLCLAGLLGITVTEDAFNTYVFLEIASLATYTLIAMGKSRRSLIAGFEYLILGTIGATFYLIGVGLLYMMTGTLNIGDLAVRIHQASDIRPIQAAFAFMTLGLAMKIALFPLHQWLTNAYTHAPAVMSAFLAATATKVGIYVLIRFLFTAFGFEFSFHSMPLAPILLVLSLLAMFVGSLIAISQDDIKRMLAFSSVAQIGYIILGLSLASETGIIGGLTHLFNHAITKGGLFLIAGVVLWKKTGVTLTHFAGTGKQMPLIMPAWIIGSLSLVGIPLTAGFVSKWYLILGAIREGVWFAVAMILVTSLMALYYCWRVIEAAYFKEAAIPVKPGKSIPFSMTLTVWFITLAIIYVGIDTSLTAGTAEKVAVFLIQGRLWY